MTVTLDRYVARVVAGSWLASLCFFLFLSILIDLLNNVGLYLERAGQEGIGLLGMAGFLGRYYAALLPSFFVTIAPFATVIACMFAIARLMAANEVVPMLFVGRSMVRVLRPVLATGALAGLGMVACWQWVVPSLRTQVEQSTSLLSGAGELRGVVVVDRAAGLSRSLYVGTYVPLERRMASVMLLLEAAGGDAMLLRATGAQWDDAQADWRLEGGVLQRADRPDQPREWLAEPAFTPDRVASAGRENVESEFLSYTDLLELRRLRPTRADVTMALHRHVTYPLANVILLLLALPFAVYFERGSRIERVLGAIAVCGAYLLVDLTCQSLGHKEYLHPIVAAWSPTILFGALGIVSFGGVRS